MNIDYTEMKQSTAPKCHSCGAHRPTPCAADCPDARREREALEKLRAAAKAASKGPWYANDWQEDDGEHKFTIEFRAPEVLRPGQSSIWPDGLEHHRVADTAEGNSPLADAAYIAAANPAAVLDLIARIEQLEARAAIGTAAPVAGSMPTDRDLEQRAIGRAEAAAILLGLDAETALEDCISGSQDESGECNSYWLTDMVHELFRTSDTVYSVQQQAQGEYWQNLHLREEAERNLAAPVSVPAGFLSLTGSKAIDGAREYLVEFMMTHFNDKTFHRYIRADPVGRSRLAGDFAFELARAIANLAAPAPKTAARLTDEPT